MNLPMRVCFLKLSFWHYVVFYVFLSRDIMHLYTINFSLNDYGKKSYEQVGIVHTFLRRIWKKKRFIDDSFFFLPTKEGNTQTNNFIQISHLSFSFSRTLFCDSLWVINHLHHTFLDFALFLLKDSSKKKKR